MTDCLASNRWKRRYFSLSFLVFFFKREDRKKEEQRKERKKCKKQKNMRRVFRSNEKIKIKSRRMRMIVTSERATTHPSFFSLLSLYFSLIFSFSSFSLSPLSLPFITHLFLTSLLPLTHSEFQVRISLIQEKKDSE